MPEKNNRKFIEVRLYSPFWILRGYFKAVWRDARQSLDMLISRKYRSLILVFLSALFWFLDYFWLALAAVSVLLIVVRAGTWLMSLFAAIMFTALVVFELQGLNGAVRICGDILLAVLIASLPRYPINSEAKKSTGKFRTHGYSSEKKSARRFGYGKAAYLAIFAIVSIWLFAFGFSGLNRSAEPLGRIFDFFAEMKHVRENSAKNDAFIDSDYDGIVDAEEKNHYHTDPFNPDTDGDGRGDRIEIEEHSDPLLK